MPHDRINEIQSSFDEIYAFIADFPNQTITNLVTTGGIPFEATAKETRDGRRFISLPHNNRIYETDWGYRFNSMGKTGQRIGQYSVPINNALIHQNN